jgi:hypothetical protein
MDLNIQYVIKVGYAKLDVPTYSLRLWPVISQIHTEYTIQVNIPHVVEMELVSEDLSILN